MCYLMNKFEIVYKKYNSFHNYICYFIDKFSFVKIDLFIQPFFHITLISPVKSKIYIILIWSPSYTILDSLVSL
jgi:hypothetical protein